MKNRFLKIACLTILMTGSALHAMNLAEHGLRKKTQSRLDKQLLKAVKKGNETHVKDLIAQGANVNAKSNWGWPALTKAARKGHIGMCKLLITHNADVNARDELGGTALMDAVEYDQKDVCELLIAHGAHVNARNQQGVTALELAAIEGHKDACKLLIENGADLNARDFRDLTALAIAAAKGYKEICTLLIDALVKPKKEQLAPIITMLGIQKKAAHLELVSRDIIRLIGTDACNQIRHKNKTIARDQIMEVTNQKSKQELLNYL
jgi:hypothetical protein